MTRLVAYQDQDALSELRLGAVVLDRRGEVWQVLMVRYAEQPTRGWFRLGDTGSIYGAGAVAEQGPLRVLYDRGTDLPENVEPCPVCGGTTNDPDSDPANITPCINCSGAGWFITNWPDHPPASMPIALAEALDLRAALAPVAAPQGLLPPVSLVEGMTVDAEPKAAHVGRARPVRGRVHVVHNPTDPRGAVDLYADLGDGLVKYRCPIDEYSFRPVEDA